MLDKKKVFQTHRYNISTTIYFHYSNRIRWDLYQVSSTVSIFTFSVKQSTIWERCCLVHIVFRFAIFVQECWTTTVRLEYVTREWNLFQSKVEFACESSSTIIRIKSQQLKCHVWPLNAATKFSHALAYTNPIYLEFCHQITYWILNLSIVAFDCRLFALSSAPIHRLMVVMMAMSYHPIR